MKPIRTLVITDTETTGLVPETDRVVEVAAMLYDVEHATPIESFSALMHAEENAAESVNRIPATLLRTISGFAWARVSGMVQAAMQRGEACYVAHRASFDRSFYPSDIAKTMPWVCSKFDIEWPRSKVGDSLVQVAVSHDVPIITAHRAMADVETLGRIFTRCAELGCDLGAMLAKAMRPKALYRAMVSYDDREKAKAAGFAWDGATKRWTRHLAKEDAGSLGFEVQEIG